MLRHDFPMVGENQTPGQCMFDPDRDRAWVHKTAGLWELFRPLTLSFRSALARGAASGGGGRARAASPAHLLSYCTNVPVHVGTTSNASHLSIPGWRSIVTICDVTPVYVCCVTISGCRSKSDTRRLNGTFRALSPAAANYR